MPGFRKSLKSLVFPVTLLTIITVISIIVSINALFIAFTNDSPSAIYAAVAIPVTLIIIFLYIMERIIIKKVRYSRLITAEIIIGLFVFFIVSFQGSTTDINFHTNKDYFLVIFDARENSISRFSRKGIFGRELNIYDRNIIHLDSTMSLRKDIRINGPDSWARSFTSTRGIFEERGRSIEYIFTTRNLPAPGNKKNKAAYLDSLLKKEIIK